MREERVCECVCLAREVGRRAHPLYILVALTYDRLVLALELCHPPATRTSVTPFELARAPTHRPRLRWQGGVAEKK